MKKRILAVALVFFALLLIGLGKLWAQYTSTPNLNLQLPTIGDTANWGTYINNDLLILDSLLGCVSNSAATCNVVGPIAAASLSLTGTVSSTSSVTAAYFQSRSANVAQSGTVRLASTDVGDCWRNNANSADVCLSKNSSDYLLIPAAILTSAILNNPSIQYTAGGFTSYSSQYWIYNVSSGNTSISSSVIVPSVSASGVFNVLIYAYDSAAGTGCTGNTTVVWNIGYNDPTGTHQIKTATETITTNGGSTGGDSLGTSIVINASTGAAISFTTTYTVGTGCSLPPSYAGNVSVNQ